MKTDHIQAFAENVWTVDGPLVRDMGIWFTTRMTVVRLSSGSLWLNSPVLVPSPTLERIKGLGEVAYLVAATPRHVWRLEKWHALVPKAELWVTPQIKTRLKFMMVLPRHELSYAGTLGDTPPHGWGDDVDQLVFKGSHLLKELAFFHKATRTLIVDDIIQSHELRSGKPFYNSMVRLGGVESPGGVPRDIRLTFTNRRLARQSLERLLSWDFDRLIIAHGACVEKDAKAFVEKAFRWLR